MIREYLLFSMQVFKRGFKSYGWEIPPGYIEFTTVFNGQNIPYKVVDYNPQTKLFYWLAGRQVLDRLLFDLSPYANAVPPEIHAPLVALQLQRLDGTLNVDWIMKLTNRALGFNNSSPPPPPPHLLGDRSHGPL
ncbi:hypothetical protein NP233_g6424 [Leucocoprinus birnbaumii]|uniref:Uncharacterized protein n=1 Tax=Leucocoprinus birnbaumii TaxID=56174 RepID=A0AAD5VTW2_9AGAR|nr:hypothetical protein NP233_g6424 [Leucocoprinus birnbaumii]